MIKLYAMDLRPFEGGLWRKNLDTLPTERKERALACRKEDDAMRIACAGYLLQHALSEEGIEHPVFAKNEWGKPYLADRDDLHFSLSHSGTWAVCAISDASVGVDIERPRNMDKIANLFPDAKTDDDMLRLWTAKEAYLKLIGRGLTVPLDSISVRLGEALVLEGLPYFLHEYQLDNYRVCLCTEDTKPTLIIK